MKNDISVACVAGIEACRSDAMVGSAGRYMSIANGPTAQSRPRTMAFFAKVESIGNSGFLNEARPDRSGRGEVVGGESDGAMSLRCLEGFLLGEFLQIGEALLELL